MTNLTLNLCQSTVPGSPLNNEGSSKSYLAIIRVEIISVINVFHQLTIKIGYFYCSLGCKIRQKDESGLINSLGTLIQENNRVKDGPGYGPVDTAQLKILTEVLNQLNRCLNDYLMRWGYIKQLMNFMKVNYYNKKRGKFPLRKFCTYKFIEWVGCHFIP